MNSVDTNNSSVIGLDVGTSRVVAARPNGQDFRYEIQLNSFVNIPFSRLTQGVLQKEQVPQTVEGAEITVFGNESERFAALLNTDTRRPMLRGRLNSEESESLKLIREITSLLTGKAKNSEKLCFTVPAPSLGNEAGTTYHESTLRRMLGEAGFEVMSINEGLAVVYSELQDTNYTGIGISCGGGLCNVCLSYLSVPIFSFSIPKAGDYVDSGAAKTTGERANTIRLLKEQSFHYNGDYSDQIRQALTTYYDDVISALVAAMNEAFAAASTLPKFPRAVPIVLSGGTAIPKGFRDRFEKALRASNFPVPLSEIRQAPEPLTAAAKGALVAALADL